MEHEISLVDVTDYGLLATSMGKNQYLGSLTWSNEFSSLPRVGDCMQVQTDYNSWTPHYHIVDVLWSVYPDNKAHNRKDTEEKFKRDDWKLTYPAQISLRNTNCPYTGDAGGRYEADAIKFADDPVVVEAMDVARNERATEVRQKEIGD